MIYFVYAELHFMLLAGHRPRQIQHAAAQAERFHTRHAPGRARPARVRCAAFASGCQRRHSAAVAASALALPAAGFAPEAGCSAAAPPFRIRGFSAARLSALFSLSPAAFACRAFGSPASVSPPPLSPFTPRLSLKRYDDAFCCQFSLILSRRFFFQIYSYAADVFSSMFLSLRCVFRFSC